MNTVSVEAFARSVAALRRALEQYRENEGGALRVMARDALVLNFEICYGQCRPALLRCLESYDGIDGLALDSYDLRNPDPHGE